MKKSILFIFALIPILASCNTSENGFVNPFPEDTYHPSGFNFNEDERVSRLLTTSEQTLVSDTIKTPNDNLVTSHSITVETRDYTRAFAGEFKQGYSASNTKESKEIYTYRQEPSKEPLNPEGELKRRTVTHTDTDAIYDYSYGRNTSKVTTDEWHYYAIVDNTPPSNEAITYIENKNHTAEPIPFEKGSEFIISQVKSSESKTNSGSILAERKEVEINEEDPTSQYIWEDGVEDATFNIGLEHSQFLTKISDCSLTPGADKDDNIILVKIEEKKYKDPSETIEEGIYQLPDGRRYQAMEKSLLVSRLELQKAKNEEESPWYLVSYARQYKEITITSDVIQPNVPITMLSNPIVINYTEEIHHFKTSEVEKTQDPLDPVEIEVVE